MISAEYRTDLINAAMGAQRMTAEQLAEKTGIGLTTISVIRNGHPNPTYTTLKKVADALGLTMQDLFTPKPEQAEEGSPATA